MNRTKQLKRTQGIAQAAGETVSPKLDIASSMLKERTAMSWVSQKPKQRNRKARFQRVRRGRERAWHVRREADRNLGDPARSTEQRELGKRHKGEGLTRPASGNAGNRHKSKS